MPEINEELTRKVADLARLELSPSEVSTFSAQLQKIVAYVDQLASVNVDGVEPLVHPLELKTAWREDESRPSPRVADGGFEVPPIL